MTLNTSLFKISLLVGTILASFIILFIKVDAQAIPGLLFGGRVVFIDPNPATVCLPNPTSPGGYLFTIAVPKGGNFIFTPATLPYPNGPTRNIGQAILGKPSPVPTACLVPCPAIGIPAPGLCPHPATLTTAGAALPVLFQGSSAI